MPKDEFVTLCQLKAPVAATPLALCGFQPTAEFMEGTAMLKLLDLTKRAPPEIGVREDVMIPSSVGLAPRGQTLP